MPEVRVHLQCRKTHSFGHAKNVACQKNPSACHSLPCACRMLAGGLSMTKRCFCGLPKVTFSIISCSSSVILTFVYQCLLAQACLCGPYVGPMSGRWDRHLSGVATQFSGVGGSAIFIDFLDSARGSTSQKRVESGGPDLGTPRAWSFALNAGALGVPSSGPL